MPAATQWMERHQVPLYLAALALGAACGLLLPAVAHPAEVALNPALGLLLYATFLGVPFTSIGRALRDWRFLITVLAVNFLLVPLVAFLLSRLVMDDRALMVGVLFVLLAPCVDYVIVFTGIAGGAQDRLVAAAPILLLAQMFLLPLYLRAFVGAQMVADINPAPFATALLSLILLPLTAAALTQIAAAHTRWGTALSDGVLSAMVPLMMLTLAVVVASQISGVRQRIGTLLTVVPLYVLFAVVMAAVGMIAGRSARLDTPGRRAVVFSAVTRNSLVVLPLVIALPAAFDLSPLVVVTQTLVELLVMLLLVHVVPLLIRD